MNYLVGIALTARDLEVIRDAVLGTLMLHIQQLEDSLAEGRYRDAETLGCHVVEDVTALQDIGYPVDQI